MFIAITQVIFLYCIEKPLFAETYTMANLQGVYFLLLVVVSICIAAAGNIINDYFDVKIDSINKPHKVIVQKIISKNWVVVWYILLNIVGLALSFFIENKTNIRFIGFANSIAVLTLFFYAAYFKKQFLIGNIFIALLSAWVILIITFCEVENNSISNKATFYKLSLLYAGFAFIISLIREMIKDMEDVKGDEQFGCKTIPIVLGLYATKIIVLVLVIIMIAILLIVPYYLLQFAWQFWISLLYFIVLVIAPLIWIAFKLLKANTPQSFHQLSTIVKMVMLTGILSMLFFS